MSKIYKTNMTKGVCPDWDRLDVAREYLANALDSGSAYEVVYEDNTLYITSKDTKLHPRLFLLGASTNRNNPNANGTHGDGSKVSMAVGLREGLDIKFYNSGIEWTPIFEYSEDFDEEILVIEENDMQSHGTMNDFVVSITGYTPEEIEIITERCLYLQDEAVIGRVEKCELGRVLFDKKGKLFVGGVWVCDTGFDYSYDFYPKHIHLNRDRKTVSSWDLNINTSNMLQMIETPDTIAKVIHEKKPDVRYVQYTSPKDDVKEACFNLYKEKYGGKMLVTSQSELQVKTNDGYSDIVVEDDNFVAIVKSSSSYKKLNWDRDTTTPVSVLTSILEQTGTVDYLTTQKLLEEAVELFNKRGVRWG